ncbi:MAG TPA: alpha/beta hydrolase [Limnobacter sp.]|nr:alpha/beta hydrolase [Limnobacter sp.]
MNHQAHTFTTHDQHALHIHHWLGPQGAPTLHWAHANGFNAHTYWPLLKQLTPHFKLWAWDMRGQGHSRAAGQVQTFRGWSTYYQDLVTWLDHQTEPVWLAGHSIGATTSLAAASARPNKVKGLLLTEPVLLSRKQGVVLQMSHWLGFSKKIPMAAAAARRKARFQSRQQAFANYRSKKAFATWSDEWLQAYTNHGFVDTPQGDVELACHPDWEALTFEHTEPNALRWLKNPACPVVILAGEQGSTFPTQAHPRIQKALPQARIDVVRNSTHFLPMEHTQRVVQEIMKLCKQA